MKSYEVLEKRKEERSKEQKKKPKKGLESKWKKQDRKE